MSSLIERAAQRLEQLRRAGLDPDAVPAPPLPQRDRPVASQAPARPPRGDAAAVTSRQIQIDLKALEGQGYVTPSAPSTALASQYRVIKRPLLANATGKGAVPLASGNLIMVTSALPGEGKSFTAINLAMSIAMELDYRVLLVDADVSRPSLSKAFKLPPSPGLLDLLVDPSVNVADVMLRTNVDKLSLLLSGSPHERATELLASDAMTHLVEEMGRRYPDRIIIFDSPPLLMTTEARVLATHMGQIVLVVQAERTLQSQVRSALATVESCPVKLMLLNQARGGEEEGYGYGYGYGYQAVMKEPDVAKVRLATA
jgi:exopolysaccharide/PEP-CTERM locus tyrosine autokinase